RQGRLRRALVVGEIALSLVLLVGAGLLIQTFARLIGTDPGFNPQGLVAAEIWLTGTRYDSTPAIAGFYRDLTARLEALPGVTSRIRRRSAAPCPSRASRGKSSASCAMSDRSSESSRRRPSLFLRRKPPLR